MRQQSVEQMINHKFDHLSLAWEPEINAAWVKFSHSGRPCITRGLLNDLTRVQHLIRDTARQGYEYGTAERICYQVLASGLPGVFNLGGDLALFTRLIREGDQDGLFDYAKSCIDIIHASATGYGLPITTIALVQGEAQGGGFEAALSANVLIAEKGARFGFPETVFGLFPGMGAFSFLARRVTPALAKRIIVSGKVYTADELYQLGIVDQVVANGRGEESVRAFIRQRQSRVAGLQGLDRAINRFDPLSYEELIDVVSIWVETAMQLSEKNLRLMEYLLRAQGKRWNEPVAAVPEMLQATA
ncbi:MAG: crotonase/enoyl-CoA hydratase family protein [Candidatus Sedimenticola sp. (ex Thyasira tokunagai)]